MVTASTSNADSPRRVDLFDELKNEAQSHREHRGMEISESYFSHCLLDFWQKNKGAERCKPFLGVNRPSLHFSARNISAMTPT
jgi:hypothetical protein